MFQRTLLLPSQGEDGSVGILPISTWCHNSQDHDLNLIMMSKILQFSMGTSDGLKWQFLSEFTLILFFCFNYKVGAFQCLTLFLFLMILIMVNCNCVLCCLLLCCFIPVTVQSVMGIVT
jgi:hypothetical protein